MGYYTNYKLSIHEDGDKFIHEDDAKKELAELSGYSNPFDDSCKWYNHEEDVKLLSKGYPNTVFLLEGEGEDNDDIWKKYFKNGRVQVCKGVITFDAYSPSKLK